MLRLTLSGIAVSLVCVTVPSAAQSYGHPLDHLSAAEHWAVYEALKASGRTDSTMKIAYIGLHEPPKAEVLAWRPGGGQPVRREAFVHLVQSGAGYDAVVDLAGKRVLAWRDVAGRNYMATEAEDGMVHELMIAHPDVQAGLRKRGITDQNHLWCGGSNEGFFDLPEERGRRIIRALCRDGRGRFSGPGRRIDGLVGVVDVTQRKVLRVLDRDVPVSEPEGEYDATAVGPTRPALPPLLTTQPMGPGFTVEGQQVSWENWRFHFRIDPRRGVVLSLVRWQDGTRERSILYQASLSELFVPYMDPEEPWNYQSYYDLGSYPGVFGGVASTLEPGLDCPAHARYFDAVVMSERGSPQQRVRAACLFERATGDPAWRHSRDGNRTVESRVRRDLVLRMFMTAGNYDYLFDFVFQADGTLKINAGATGMDQVKNARAAGAVSNGNGAGSTAREDRYGRFIAPHLIGVNHSHFFSWRIDLDVDGVNNTLAVDRLVTEELPAGNPRRSLWRADTRLAATERDAMRHSTMAEPEIWRVINPGVPGAYGDPVSYEISGGHHSLMLLRPDDYMRRRAGFAEHTLWVTPQDGKELFAAGDYPTFSTAGQGLPAWTAANRPIANTDIVVWYTMGFHHVPRPEDWPIMPVAWHSFELRPVGFFARNPSMDLPKTP